MQNSQTQQKTRPDGYWFKEPDESKADFYRLTDYQVKSILRQIEREDEPSLSFHDKTLKWEDSYVTVFYIHSYARIVCYPSRKAKLQFRTDYDAVRYEGSKEGRLDKSCKRFKLLFDKRTSDKSKLPPANNKVFIVHGRDHRDRDYIAGMMYEWGLEPVILGYTRVDGSPNIMTALRQLMSDVGFGIVIETPDEADGRLRDGEAGCAELSFIDRSIAREQEAMSDIASPNRDMKKKVRKALIKKAEKRINKLGKLKKKRLKKLIKKQNKMSCVEKQDTLYNTRPNVLLELGMLIGKLGEHNVARLRKRQENFVMPSDLDGVLRIEYDKIDKRDVMHSLWEKLVYRGFVMKRFDMAGCTQDSIVEKFHSRQEGVIMPGETIARNKRYF